MPIRSLQARLLLIVAGTLCALPASAVPRFTGVIASQLQLDYAPPCSVCHLTNKTDGATVTTPFGYALRARGLADGDSLPLALTQLATDRADSDGDGVSDVDELKSATDPNSRANASLVGVADPSFGCSTKGPAPTAPALLLFLLGAGAAVMRMSRPSRRPRP